MFYITFKNGPESLLQGWAKHSGAKSVKECSTVEPMAIHVHVHNMPGTHWSPSTTFHLITIQKMPSHLLLTLKCGQMHTQLRIFESRLKVDSISQTIAKLYWLLVEFNQEPREILVGAIIGSLAPVCPPLHLNCNYCIPLGRVSATHLTRPFLNFFVGGAGARD